MPEQQQEPPAVQLELELEPRIYLAAQQNGVPTVRELLLENEGQQDLEDLRLALFTEPEVSEPWELRLDALPAGGRFALSAPDLRLHPSALAAQLERVNGLLSLELRAGEALLARRSWDIQLLAPREWPGVSVLPELLAAWVMPNDPALRPVLKAASLRLGQETGDASLAGYQGQDKQRVAHIAQAIYDALRALELGYVNPPASFEEHGQKLRLPEEVLEGGLGTCIDLSLLLAALLEQVGLHPLLVLVQGHAFAGVWLTDYALPHPALDDPIPLRKRLRLGEALVFDAAAVASGAPFARAQRLAERHLVDAASFHYAIDVHAARQHGIRPLQLQVELVEEEGAPAAPLPGPESLAPLSFPEQEPAPTAAGAPTRLERWKSKLLDLTLRNRLLNFRQNKGTVQLLVPDPGQLATALAQDKALEIGPRPTLFERDDPRDVQLAQGVEQEEALERHLRQTLGRGRLHADLADQELRKRLLEIYRRARSSLEESGAITLYLALGMLRWFEDDASSQPRLAPVLLMPVSLERGGGSQPFTLRRAHEETRLNVTLLKKLETDFGLDVAGMEDLLPEEGEPDLPSVLHRFRQLLRHEERWEVLELCYLGRFAFTKFLMWLDLEAKTDQLLENPFVRHIFEGRGQAFPMLAQPVVEVDRRPAAELLTVVDADPSQLSAVYAAEDGSSFVLQGPPGTGKSQTITNLVAQLLSRGRTVLFVSEKMAALDVVRRRLDAVGLGPFCLELHSHKANKRAVMEQFKEAFVAAQSKAPEGWTAHAQRLERARAELNDFAALLGRKGPFGLSLFQVCARLSGLRQVPWVPAEFGALDAVDTPRLERLQGLAGQLAADAREVGALAAHPWKGVRRTEWSPAWQREVEAALQALLARNEQLERAAGEAQRQLGLPERVLDGECVAALQALCGALLRSPAPPLAMVQGGSFRQIQEEVRGWADCAGRRREGWEALAERFEERLLELDLPTLQLRFQRWATAFFLLAWLMLWGARRGLRLVARGGRLPANRQIADDLQRALAVRSEDAALQENDARARALLGSCWQGAQTDPQQLEALLAWAGQLRRAALQVAHLWQQPEAQQRLALLASDHQELLAPDTALRAGLESFERAALAWTEARERLADLLELDVALAWGERPGPQALRERLPAWQGRGAQLRDWCALQRSARGLEDEGLGALVRGLFEESLAPADLAPVLERSVYQWWWEGRAAEEPSLARFRGMEHELRIARFRELDLQAMELARAEVRARLAQRAPSLHVPGDEMALLRRQLQLQRRHMPLRKLFARIPTTLRRLKPCLLMSPLSVAQYLDPSLEGFDVVVFDEASQIPPWDAVGAIARGSQLVVVGDSRQLPPTSFFTRGEDESELDDSDMQEMESILEEALGAGLQELPLRWHYRSRHEALIAFSNHHYYQGRLQSLPSAEQEVPHLGVQLRAVPEGFYDRGGHRDNRAEAEAVVAELVALLSQPNPPSVGVVTFSLPQQRLIEDLTDQARQAHPEIEAQFTSAADEPVFVKNLENVQGDERDVMLFSVCYGPDRGGKLTMNFGPLNRKGGERRLNVAITRARQRTLVFATLRPDQIDLRRTRALGAAHLKAYLEYAERGVVALDRSASEAVPEPRGSVLERELEAFLAQEGWEVQAQVGCSGYRVALGVADPDQPGSYLLGVELDGPMYHGSSCARERDRLRQQVLEGLGWRLHRIWSADWWLDPEGQQQKLQSLLFRVLEEARARRAAEHEEPDPPAETGAEPQEPNGEEEEEGEEECLSFEQLAVAPAVELPAEAGPYPVLEAPSLGGPEDFHVPAASKAVARRLAQVVSRQGPMAFDEACRQVIVCWGMSRLGARIRRRVERAVSSLAPAERPLRRGEWLWPVEADPESWRGFRVPREGAGLRPLERIPPEEIANAAGWVLQRALSIGEEELLRETAAVFGVSRMGKRVRAVALEGLDRLTEQGRCRREGGRYKVVAGERG